MNKIKLGLVPSLFLVLILLVACSGNAAQPEFKVITHPDGSLYIGDQVSFEVLLQDGIAGQTLTVNFEGQDLGSATLTPHGIGQRLLATFWWIWDTSELKPGKYWLTFTLDNGVSYQEEFRLRDKKYLPDSELQAAWDSTVTDCCSIYYLTGTDAERDLIDLSAVADQESTAVSGQLGTTLQERITLIFMPRVVGHGGFAWNGDYISYLDENYVGNELDMVLHHEFVHYYDGWIGGTYLPSIFRGGLAVFLSGGHFKPEPIRERAAAMLDLGWYIPLATLTDDFYNQQHDVSYLEAAALVQYLHDTYGPGAFMEFYRTIDYLEGKTDSEILDKALQQDCALTLDELEINYLDYLSDQEFSEETRLDLELTIANYDLIRRYQSLFDPSAYFLTAWLPDGQLMREKGIVADLYRRPIAWQNLLVEKLLRRTNVDLFSGQYESAERDIHFTNGLLDFLAP